MAANNGEFWRRVINMVGKPRKAVASVEQIQLNVSSVPGKEDGSAATGEALSLNVQCMLGVVEGARSLCAPMEKL